MFKKIFREMVFPVAVALGTEKLLRSFSKNKRLILMYHGVVPGADFRFSVNHLSVKDFETHIRYLKKNYRIVSLEEMFQSYRNDTHEKQNTLSITFDDGYANNYRFAFPVLKKYDVPATIFVVAQSLENPDTMLWYDHIDSVKDKIPYSELIYQDFGFDDSKTKALRKINTVSVLKSFMKKLSTLEKNRILDWLKEKGIYPLIGNHHDFTDLLTVAEMKEMTDTGLVEIGSHSYSHPNLSEISLEEAGMEIKKSKSVIELATGHPVKSIAFPDGSYNESIKKICMAAGYLNMLAVDYRLSEDKTDKNILPRFCISNTTTPESNFLKLSLCFGKFGT